MGIIFDIIEEDMKSIRYVKEKSRETLIMLFQ